MFEILIAKIADGLKGNNIDYMIIGGQAVLVHGELRVTKDIDITLAVDTDQLPAVLSLLGNLKLRCLVDNPVDFIRKTKVLPAVDDSSGIRIDFMFSSSEFERTAIGRAISLKFGQSDVKFATMEDLIIHKTIAGRPRDLEDIKSVLLKNRNYDREYIEKWLREFDKAPDTAYLKSFKGIISQSD